MVLMPASLGSSGCFWPGLAMSAILRAEARPKTTMSRRELAPRRLAPWTEAQAASPAAKRPLTVASGSPAKEQRRQKRRKKRNEREETSWLKVNQSRGGNLHHLPFFCPLALGHSPFLGCTTSPW